MSSEPSDYRKVLESIARQKSSVTAVFSDFVRMVACALATGTREEEYFEAIKGYSKEELLEFSKAMGMLIQEMDENPYKDRLGTYYGEIASKATIDSRGEFYTPDSISEMIARMTVDVDKVAEVGYPISIHEPSVGAGGMILAVARLFRAKEVSIDLMRTTCIDISPTAVDMCYINTTLWGIPSQILCGNTLTNEYHSEYKNIHWERVQEDTRLRFKALELLAENRRDELGKSDYEMPVDKKPLISEAREQMELDL